MDTNDSCWGFLLQKKLNFDGKCGPRVWRFQCFSSSSNEDIYISPNWHQHVICLTPSWSTTKEFLPRHEISNNVVRTTRNSSDQPAHTFLLEYSLTVKPPNILRQILDPFHTTISTFIQSCSENKVTQCAFC